MVSRRDYLIAALLALFIAGTTAYLLAPGLVPAAWQGFCEAARVRPPECPFPGVWRLFAAGVMRLCGLSRGIVALQYLGPVALGLVSGVFYLSVREFLPYFLRFSQRHPSWDNHIAPFVVALATVAFAFSAPMNALAQAFTADALHVLLAFVVVWLLLRFVRSGHFVYVYLGMFVCGALAAEMPVGIVLLAFYTLFVIFWPLTASAVEMRFASWDPAVVEFSKWTLTACLLVGFGLALTVDLYSFARFGGAEADALFPLLWSERWIVDMGRAFGSVATAGGWTMIVVLGVVATVAGWMLLPKATNDEKLLSYGHGLVYLGLGVFSLAQLSSLDALRYLTWFNGAGVTTSPVLGAFAALFSALAFVAALAVGCIEVFCRNTALILKTTNPESALQPLFEKIVEKGRRITHRNRRIVAWAAPLLIVVCVLPSRLMPRARTVYRALDEYVDLMLAESAGVECVFSDGHFDPLLELRARTRGRWTFAHSMFARNSPHVRLLRQRSRRDAEDDMVMRLSTPALLKNWVEERTNRLDGAAFQVGFEMWQRQKRPLPAAGGTMARVAWPDAAVRRQNVARARELGWRMYDVYAAGRFPPVERAVRELFDEALWRLSRMARLRAHVADRAHNLALATQEQEFADRLDAANPSFQLLRESIGLKRSADTSELTPREGLRVALARPDFRLARQFALTVLEADPEDPDANFAVGMAYLTEQQWTRAEEYLKRVLVRHPGEPAVFNNLAAVCYNQSRYEEAEKWAKQAVERLPDSAEARETLRTIQEKIKTLRAPQERQKVKK